MDAISSPAVSPAQIRTPAKPTGGAAAGTDAPAADHDSFDRSKPHYTIGDRLRAVNADQKAAAYGVPFAILLGAPCAVINPLGLLAVPGLIAAVNLYCLVDGFLHPEGEGAQPQAPKIQESPAMEGQVKTRSGLKYSVLHEGEGELAQPGQSVAVQYTGWLTPDGSTKGKKFDSSLDRNQPFQFQLGNHEVIAGWDEGVAGMKVGEERELIVPPSLGYGKQQVGEIPRNSTLIFDVSLSGTK